ncbi:DinB family protein [Streptomyces sp. TRM66268-LWL]|uniref:DinB family protein n=1 Tax=Streptomyces polyasparticus TaxID=2767826 RepID=A0ABR7SHZ0_9ACTN|nr:DinB family protein [Streptomyces polyasparticus]MBC9715102.1 DinB family protein [Streptomyces polyasparticus]
MTTDAQAKAHLLRYLQAAREALLWKVDGLSEYDIRRPLTPTGTNLLGLVKHVAGTEAGYLGDVFGRPFPEPLPWMAEDAEANADMWAGPDESREDVVGLYRRVWEHSDATVEALELGATGVVPWWHPDRREVTLEQILIHMIAESHRHAGHADIVRELVDGSVGMRKGNENLPSTDTDWWKAHYDRLEMAAKQAQED